MKQVRVKCEFLSPYNYGRKDDNGALAFDGDGEVMSVKEANKAIEKTVNRSGGKLYKSDFKLVEVK